MKRLLGLFAFILLQGCALAPVSIPAETNSSAKSEMAKVVIRNGANRELYAGTVPLTLVLKPGSGKGVAPHYAVRVELQVANQSAGLVLHYGLGGWSVESGEGAGERRLPFGVLFVSLNGSMPAFSTDKLTGAQEARVNRDDLIVILTDRLPPRPSGSIL